MTVPASRIAILGAGVMGAGITQVFQAAGVEVAVFDPVPAARESFPSFGGAGTVSVHDRLAAAVAGADLVIEAAPENVAVKRAIFAELSEAAGESTWLASNTSSIPISEITVGMREASRVIGMHFWQPPALVPLVEVVRAARSDPAAVAYGMELLTAIGMTPVRVEADIPGFLGNRLQHALKREAIALVAAGVCTAETVDLVVTRGFGARLAAVGPLEQSDLNGTPLTLAIHEVLMPHLDVTAEPHPYLVDMVARGDHGASTGRGFRTWLPGQAERRRAEITAELTRSSTMRMNNPSDGQ